MKVVLAIFYGFLLSTSFLANSQEAKLVEQGEWGSGVYQDMVEINGYYYIRTTSNQIDIINPEITNKESLIGQISFDSEDESSIYSIGKFKDFLVVVFQGKLVIYNISNIKELTPAYSLAVNPSYSKPTQKDDYLYFVSADSKIFIIKYDQDNFSITKVINSKASDWETNTSIGNRSLFTDNAALYYLYGSNKNGELSTYIEKYQLSDYSKIDSGILDGLQLNNESISVGDERFVIQASSQYYLIKLINGEIKILDDFNNEKNGYISNFAFNSNRLYASSWGGELQTFQISDVSDVTLLSTEYLGSYLSANANISFLRWIKGKLIGLEDNFGLFELKLSNDSVDNIKFFYNQSGELGKSVIKNNLLYVPRKKRIDVVDLSNLNNLHRVNKLIVPAQDILPFGDEFIFSTYSSIADFSLIDGSSFQENSKVNISVQNNVLKHYPFIYHLSYINNAYQVRRYKMTTPYSFYESPVVASITQNNTCPQQLNIVSNKLVAFDPCGSNNIHLFLNYDGDNFAYQKTIEHNYAYWNVETVGDYIYFISPKEIRVVKLTDNDELKDIASINIEFSANTGITKSKVVGNYLLVTSQNYISLVDVSVAENPMLISKTKLIKWLGYDLKFQLQDGYVLVSTGYQGKVKIFQINTAPVMNEANLTVTEDEASIGDITFSDPENDEITVTVLTEPENGTINITDNIVTYTPNENFFGTDLALIKTQDIYENSTEKELNIAVVAVNDAPIITTETLLLDEDTTLVIDIASQDVENDSVEYQLTTAPVNGVASITKQGKLTYQPNSNFNGNDNLAITVTDSNGASSEKTLAITIAPINDTPVFNDVSFTIDEDSSLEDVLSAADIDGNTLFFAMVTQPSSGNITLNELGDFIYQPNANFDQQDSFTVAVDDKQGGVAQSIVSVNINAINDAPVMGDNNFFTNEDLTLVNSIKVTDVDSSALSYEIIENPENAIVTVDSEGEFTFTPNTDYTGIEQFTVRITDDQEASVEGIITVTIDSFNDAPIFTDTNYSVDEDNTLTGTLVATDIEAQAISFELVDSSNLQGEVNVNTNGDFSFIPMANFYGNTTFKAKAIDSGGAATEQIITIEVIAVDDIPVVENNTIIASFGKTVSGKMPTQDVDNQVLNYTVVSDVSNGALTLSAAGEYQYTPTTGFAGTDSFTYQVTDINNNSAQATMTFNVQAKPQESKTSSGGSINYLFLYLLISIFSYRKFKKVNLL
jgi:VCBS repeat-containing protein